MIEVKRSLSPRPEKGFHHACVDLSPARRFIVYPGDERYPLKADVDAMPLPALARLLERRVDDRRAQTVYIAGDNGTSGEGGMNGG